MTVNKNQEARYAVACVIADEVFFISFHTRDEEEALQLATCICGKDARKSLVIITDQGKVIPIYAL